MSEPEKTIMTDEERIELAKKLDRELDDFINGLEKKKYTDGWHEDRWEEEMAKHPFFMKSAPENGELSPLAQGLANLKYDPDENTPTQLAENYKEDGNFNFKHKNYRLAIMGYTEGIKVKCDDAALNASLYNNRSAAHFQLKNYRSSLLDAEKALQYDPNHFKAKMRAANCCYNMEKYDGCVKYWQDILKDQPDCEDVKNLLQKSMKRSQMKLRDERKRQKLHKITDSKREELLKAIKESGIKISNLEDADDLNLSKLEPSLPDTIDAMVHLEDGVLRWPLLVLYPEFGTTDFVRNCPENVPLIVQLEQLFPAPWDDKSVYKISDVNVYFEGWDRKVHKVDFGRSFGELLRDRYFELKAGTPAFFVVVRNSEAEKQFLKSYS